MKLSIKAFGLAGGIVWGAIIALCGWLAWLTGWGEETVTLFRTFYFGYGPTFFGGLLGGLCGLVDGFIIGAVFAWLYNKLAK